MDRRLTVRALRVGEVNRASSVEALPGGKAAHVAMACAALGWKPVWTGFLGGAIGQECAAGLRALGIEVAEMLTSAPTRVNLELVEESGVVTEVLEPGTSPTAEEQRTMLDLCAQRLSGEWKGATFVISGSLPAGIRPDFYASLISSAHAAGSRVLLDTSGEWLLHGLKAHPDFVKVNSSEAAALLESSQKSHEFAVSAAREFVARGAASVSITAGKEGLVWMESRSGPVWRARPPEVKCKSPVGCGDTTLAGFAHAMLNGMSGADALKFATACGAANCLAPVTARISLHDVQNLVPQVRVEAL